MKLHAQGVDAGRTSQRLLRPGARKQLVGAIQGFVVGLQLPFQTQNVLVGFDDVEHQVGALRMIQALGPAQSAARPGNGLLVHEAPEATEKRLVELDRQPRTTTDRIVEIGTIAGAKHTGAL